MNSRIGRWQHFSQIKNMKELLHPNRWRKKIWEKLIWKKYLESNKVVLVIHKDNSTRINRKKKKLVYKWSLK